MRRFASLVVLSFPALLAGCHSHYIQATITNGSASPISVVQVDYPTASFGTQSLAPGAAFHYRFKLLGSGNVRITYTDAKQHETTVQGPWMNEGQEGTLGINFAQDGKPVFAPSLKP